MTTEMLENDDDDSEFVILFMWAWYGNGENKVYVKKLS